MLSQTCPARPASRLTNAGNPMSINTSQRRRIYCGLDIAFVLAGPVGARTWLPAPAVKLPSHECFTSAEPEASGAALRASGKSFVCGNRETFQRVNTVLGTATADAAGKSKEASTFPIMPP